MMSHARFATLMGEHQLLADRRRRMLTSAMLALMACSAAGTLTWLGDKMGVHAVAPPKNAYEVSLSLVEAPPPQSPPPAVSGASSDQKDDDAEIPPDEPVQPPDPRDELIEDPQPTKPVVPRRGSGVPTGAGGKGPTGIGLIGNGNGTGICLLPPCIGKDPPVHPPPLPPPPGDPPPKVEPTSVTMARAKFSPDPDPKALARTPTGRTHRRSGRASVAFCIDPHGKTYDVRTRTHFRGDPEVDKICRQTVARWRFDPLVAGGKARRSCTTVTFDIRFE